MCVEPTSEQRQSTVAVNLTPLPQGCNLGGSSCCTCADLAPMLRHRSDVDKLDASSVARKTLRNIARNARSRLRPVRLLRSNTRVAAQRATRRRSCLLDVVRTVRSLRFARFMLSVVSCCLVLSARSAGRSSFRQAARSIRSAATRGAKQAITCYASGHRGCLVPVTCVCTKWGWRGC